MQTKQIEPQLTGKMMVESAPNIINQQDIITLTKKAVQGKSERQRFKKAKKFLYNALEFKSPRVDIQQSDRTQSARLAHKIETNPRYRTMLLILSYIFMYLAFAQNYYSPILIGFELLIITIFIFFLVLEILHKIFYKRTTEKKFNLKLYIKAISLALLLIDSILALARQDLRIRYFLILRCVLPVTIDAQVRKLFYALLKTYKVIIVYIIFYFLVIIAFGIMANQFIEYSDPKYYYENYKDLGNSIFLMYVLTTFDNYPDSQQNILKTGLWIYPFFIVYILLIALLFAAIPINIIMDSIKETRSKSIIIDELEQQHNIIMSFIALGGDKTQSIPSKVFIKFLLYLFNFQDKYLDKILSICKNVDDSVDGKIQCSQYMQICKIIQSREYLSPPKHRYWKKLAPFEKYLQTKYKLKQIIKNKKFPLYEGIFAVFIFINCLLDIYVHNRVFDIIDDINMIIMVTVTCFKLVAIGPEIFFNNYLNIFDLVVVIIALYFEIAPASISPRSASIIAKMFRIYKINQIFDFISEKFRFRSSIYDKFSQLVTHIGLLFPILLQFFPLYLISFYALGVLGTQIFSYHINTETDYSSNRQFSNFDTLVGSQFLLIQILVEASWSFLVFDHIARYGYYTLIVIFFIFCHQIIVILLSSLFKGIVWQCYNTISEAQDDHNQKRKDKEKILQGLIRRYKQFNILKKKIKKSNIIEPTDPFIRELYQRKVDMYILERLKIQYRINKVQKQLNNKMLTFSKIYLPNKSESLNRVNRSSINQQKQYIESHNLIFHQESIVHTFFKTQLVQKKDYIQKEQIYLNKKRKQENDIEPIKKVSMSIDEIISKQVDIESDSQEMDEIQQNAEKLYDDQYESKVNMLMNQVGLHDTYDLKLCVESPKCFIDYLQNKLKKLRKDLPEQQLLQFDVHKEPFGSTSSIADTLISDISSLLEFTTSDKQKKLTIINQMVDMGIIDEKKAEIMLFQSSQYENQLTFDYNWVIRKTYLSDFSQNDIKEFQMKYFTEVFGEKFKKISKVTLDSIMNMEAKIIYSLGNLLRYPKVQSETFFRTLLSIENKINVELLKQGSLCKFVYQIKSYQDVWLTLDLKDSNQIGIQFMKSGVWFSSSNKLEKDEIYVSKNIFNWEGYENRSDKQQCQKYIKKFFQTFESLAFSSNDKQCFFNPFPQNRCYDLFTFYRDVENCERINKNPIQITKIMFFILSNDKSKEKNIPFSISDFEYSKEQKSEYIDNIKIKFKLDQNQEQMSEILGQLQNQNEYRRYREGLPYAYMVNFFTQVKEMMMINQKNFVYHIEKVLRNHLEQETLSYTNTKQNTNKNQNRFTRLKKKRQNN